MTPGVHVTRHAAERWVERIDSRATPDEAKAAIASHSRAILVAAGFGCSVVRTGSAKLVLDGATVTTVLPRRVIVHRGDLA